MVVEVAKGTEVSAPEVKTKIPLQRLLRILAVVGIIAAALFLFFVKRYSDISTKWIVIIGVGVAAAAAGMFFAFEIYNYIKGRGKQEAIASQKLPPAISLGECNKIVDEAFVYNGYFGQYRGETFESGPELHGTPPQKIFKLVFQGRRDKVRYLVAINMHYPELRKIVTNPSDAQIRNVPRLLTVNPEPEPTQEIVVESNPLAGYERTIQRQVKAGEKEQTKEDLA